MRRQRGKERAHLVYAVPSSSRKRGALCSVGMGGKRETNSGLGRRARGRAERGEGIERLLRLRMAAGSRCGVKWPVDLGYVNNDNKS